MKFFFDENVAPGLVAVAKLLGSDAVHLFDEFPPGTRDEAFIPTVAAHGWVLVTIDHRLRRNPEQILMLRGIPGITVIWLPKKLSEVTREKQVEWIARYWGSIEAFVSAEQQGCWEVSENGVVRPAVFPSLERAEKRIAQQGRSREPQAKKP